jgi:hypothetical protein
MMLRTWPVMAIKSLTWWDDANCGPKHFNPDPTFTVTDEVQLAQMRLAVFFPVGDHVTTSTPKKKRHAHPNNDPIYKTAHGICASCPVRGECLADALTIPPGEDISGFRAGTTATDRHKIRDDMRLKEAIEWKPSRLA